LIIIAFPDRAHASGWRQSAAYQAILPLRRDNTEGELTFVLLAGFAMAMFIIASGL
jgi:uncharacterized protein (DUF1330 family)